MKKVEDKDNRRSTRLGSILAIVALMGTICVSLFKLTTYLMDEWSEKSKVFDFYLWVVLLAILAATLIITYDLVEFVCVDLKRYNVLIQRYKQYDEESDKCYQNLIDDFRIFTRGLVVILSVSVPLSMFMIKLFGGRIFKLTMIVYCIWCKNRLAAGIEYAKTNQEFAQLVFERIMTWGAISFITFGAIWGFQCESKLKMEATYTEKGQVIIKSESPKSVSHLHIVLYEDNGIEEHAREVDEPDLLVGKEMKYTRDWKYVFDINSLHLKSGKYKISILVKYNDTESELTNMFEIKDHTYTFGSDVISKHY